MCFLTFDSLVYLHLTKTCFLYGKSTFMHNITDTEIFIYQCTKFLEYLNPQIRGSPKIDKSLLQILTHETTKEVPFATIKYHDKDKVLHRTTSQKAP